MKRNKIPIETLRRRLSRHLGYDVPINRFAVLLHGWMRKLNYEIRIAQRKQKAGFAYLFEDETAAFSAYAGYDLTHD